ncbi:hypothetical protein ACNQFZ_20505 [Schinkia sp. CFF1]
MKLTFCYLLFHLPERWLIKDLKNKILGFSIPHSLIAPWVNALSSWYSLNDQIKKNAYLHVTQEMKKVASQKFGQLMRGFD